MFALLTPFGLLTTAIGATAAAFIYLRSIAGSTTSAIVDIVSRAASWGADMILN
ncbi:MAG: hypothetical protein HC944_02810, partial [Nanoarchaeota archaeon]|nr:hypothetical protein [Nanoarchaeota archaeon]